MCALVKYVVMRELGLAMVVVVDDEVGSDKRRRQWMEID